MSIREGRKKPFPFITIYRIFRKSENSYIELLEIQKIQSRRKIFLKNILTSKDVYAILYLKVEFVVE